MAPDRKQDDFSQASQAEYEELRSYVRMRHRQPVTLHHETRISVVEWLVGVGRVALGRFRKA